MFQRHGCKGLAPCLRVEIWRLVRDPAEKLFHRWFGADGVQILSDPRKLSVGEIRMHSPMADGMDRNGCAALFGFGHRVMPLNALAQGSRAEPALGQFLSQFLCSLAQSIAARSAT